MNLLDAIAELESSSARIHAEWPEFEIGPHRIVGDELLLDDLVAFIGQQYPEIEAHKANIVQFDASGGSLLAAWLKAKQSLSSIAVALVAFIGLRKCRLTIKLKGQAISAEAANATEMERLLRVADELFIHPSDDDLH